MRFKDPWLLLLLVLWVPMVLVYIRRERRFRPAIRFSDLAAVKTAPPSLFIRARHLLLFLRLLGFGLLVVALARPQQGHSDEEVSTEGVDIMLVLDISESMRALDFQPDNRLAVAKKTIRDFIRKRSSDRIGLVVFGARSFTKCPLTLDYNVLDRFIDDITFTDFSYQTAIGTAIATAANRLKGSPAKSKVIILLTDGANNAGDIPPLTAAKAAAELGLKIHTIGVGKEGKVPMPVLVRNPFTGETKQQVQMMDSDLDEKTLRNIAETTGGTFFRAQSAEKLADIYSQIDKMEKTEIKTTIYTSFEEKFYPWLWAGFLLLMAELLLQHTRFRRIP
ncbi:MAG: VWA domain-containing protein [Chitinispirillaceae bacterium]|nr:VWA domain-containing protein [Chitinispirillaceae bacterium]